MEKDLISREDKERLLLKVQRHLSDEAETELGRFEVETLVELVARLIGPHYYNKACGTRRRCLPGRSTRSMTRFTRWSGCRRPDYFLGRIWNVCS